ncbi:uncharacterized protein Z520_11532 [Fonsecaea multimorphosa CBS 102226]|uniref:Zn(2)-C6 fungal-type domain-containing protein n=1 Tax=Fonsecaea multimorphosa CBS 102226 TaxID=1442371 RepID=A0A0D2GT73_9EURO|nr:uncharacterized protein Z520_11532 [Fonsecaea multimorphosa CBS 102226]KIX92680.1 hypothetical protein Z520_11532 [Fonsecaea multimorphosa CBS 102226]
MALPKSRPRQGQLGSRKSHDGCITCKIRKLKCDEQRPACKRCLTTGRKCDGYVHAGEKGSWIAWSPSANHAVMQVKSPPTYASVEQIEVQSFEFFVLRVVPDCSRTVDEHFWRRLLPQLSHSDPVIWDAVIALSSLIQHFQSSGQSTVAEIKTAPVVKGDHRRALAWYGKSIARLRAGLKQGATRPTTAVISCILYICIECLQDHPSEAIALYQRAVAMMEATAEPEHQTCRTTQSESSVASTVRALLQNMSASQRLPLSRGMVFNNPPLETLSAARDSLFVLLFAAHDFLVDTREIRTDKPKDWTPPSDLIARQQQIRMDFLKWHSAFEDMTKCPERASIEDEVERYSLLHVVYGYYFILVCTGLSMYETDFDEFFPMFQNMVDHASRIIAPKSEELRPVFMFETRVIPSLFGVAVKCRHPVIRRQAISLLRNGTQVENTWRADTMADIAEWSVGIEESGSVHGVFCPQPPSQMDLPPENHRLHWSQMVELRDSDGRATKFHQVRKWEQDDNQVWSLVDHMRGLLALRLSKGEFQISRLSVSDE